MNNKLILTFIAAVLLLAGLASCDDHGKATPQSYPVITLYVKGYSLGEPLYLLRDNKYKTQHESNAYSYLRGNILTFPDEDTRYHFSLVRSSDTTHVLKEFELTHPGLGDGYNQLMFFKYLYDGEQLIERIDIPEPPEKGFTRAKFILRLGVSEYTDPVDMRFYYLPRKAGDRDYTRRDITRMNDIEYVAELKNVIPSETEFSEAVDIPLRKDSVEEAGMIYRTDWLYVDIVKAGTDELVWTVDGESAERFFEPTKLGDFGYEPSTGKNGIDKKLYEQAVAMYIFEEVRPDSTRKFGHFKFIDIEPHTHWGGKDKNGITIE